MREIDCHHSAFQVGKSETETFGSDNYYSVQCNLLELTNAKQW